MIRKYQLILKALDGGCYCLSTVAATESVMLPPWFVPGSLLGRHFSFGRYEQENPIPPRPDTALFTVAG